MHILLNSARRRVTVISALRMISKVGSKSRVSEFHVECITALAALRAFVLPVPAGNFWPQ
jgi:hypothetical protein